LKVKNRLKVLLVEKEIRQKELAEYVGVSQATIAMIANKKALPSLENALKIAKYLGVRVEDIWWLEDDEEQKKDDGKEQADNR